MPFDSNGVFSRVMNWTSDQQNGIAIECGRHDQEDDNFAEGFNECFCRDGRAAATGDFNLGSHKIKNVAAGTATTDAVNKGQLDSGLSAKANTADVVNLTGTQTITGTKTFNGDLLLSNGGTITRIIQQGDGNFCIYKDDSAILTTGTGSVKKLLAPNNQSVTVEPNEVVTTLGINKAENGYVKLGNGITLQWGRYDNGVNSAGIKGTITLPTPFASTAYSFSLVGTRGNDEDITAAVNCEGRWKSTTAIGFQCSRTSGSSAGIRYVDWVAIGY